MPPRNKKKLAPEDEKLVKDVADLLEVNDADGPEILDERDGPDFGPVDDDGKVTVTLVHPADVPPEAGPEVPEAENHAAEGEAAICAVCFGSWGAVDPDHAAVGCEHGSWSRSGPPAEAAVADLEAGDELADGSRGLVATPCRKCFPDGWPVEEVGASVNCAHDFAIVYGTPVEISREQAVELGFIEE